MATRKIEIESGCLSKVGEDEPVFVLRAADKCAPAVVLVWKLFVHLLGASVEKQSGAEQLAREMVEWQEANPNKVKVPD